MANTCSNCKHWIRANAHHNWKPTNQCSFWWKVTDKTSNRKTAYADDTCEKWEQDQRPTGD